MRVDHTIAKSGPWVSPYFLLSRSHRRSPSSVGAGPRCYATVPIEPAYSIPLSVGPHLIAEVVILWISSNVGEYKVYTRGARWVPSNKSGGLLAAGIYSIYLHLDAVRGQAF